MLLVLDQVNQNPEPDLLTVPPETRRRLALAIGGVLGAAYIAGAVDGQRDIEARRRQVGLAVSEFAPFEGVDWYAKHTLELAGIVEQAVRDTVKDIIMEARLTGQSHDQLMEQLNEVIPEVGWQRLENIARTESARIYERGKWETYSGHPDVVGYQIHAIMDSRTTPICEELNGRIIPIGTGPALWPPFHYQCRTTVSPILDIETDQPGFAWDVPPARARPMPGFGVISNG